MGKLPREYAINYNGRSESGMVYADGVLIRKKKAAQDSAGEKEEEKESEDRTWKSKKC